MTSTVEAIANSLLLLTPILGLDNPWGIVRVVLKVLGAFTLIMDWIGADRIRRGASWLHERAQEYSFYINLVPPVDAASRRFLLRWVFWWGFVSLAVIAGLGWATGLPGWFTALL